MKGEVSLPLVIVISIIIISIVLALSYILIFGTKDKLIDSFIDSSDKLASQNCDIVGALCPTNS